MVLAGPGLSWLVLARILLLSFQVFLKTRSDADCRDEWKSDKDYSRTGDFCADTDIEGITKDNCKVSFCFNLPCAIYSSMFVRLFSQ
jgi:hypothetical protein